LGEAFLSFQELVEGSRCGGGMFGGINAGLFGPIEAMLGGGELCDSLMKTK